MPKCSNCKTKIENPIAVRLFKFCGFDCAVEFAQDKQAKQRQKQIAKAKQMRIKKEKAARADFTARKLAIKPKSKWLSEAQSAFNKYIRIRDYRDPCIACMKPRELIEYEQGWKVGGCWDAGHFMTRGAKGQLRFILFNVHKRCKSCNSGGGKFSHKAATVDANYRINLIQKIGIKKVEWLENNNELDLVKGDIEYLKRIKRIFNKRARFYAKRKGV